MSRDRERHIPAITFDHELDDDGFWDDWEEDCEYEDDWYEDPFVKEWHEWCGVTTRRIRNGC